MIKAEDFESLATYLRTSPAPDQATLDSMLAHALRQNFIDGIDLFIANGASLLSDAAFSVLLATSAFPSFSRYFRVTLLC